MTDLDRISPDIEFAAGGSMIPHYGERVNKIRLHNTDHMTENETEYCHYVVLCRVEPSGKVELTGSIAGWAQDFKNMWDSCD